MLVCLYQFSQSFLNRSVSQKSPNKSLFFRWRAGVYRERHFQPTTGAAPRANPGPCARGEGGGGLTAAGWSAGPLST